MSDIMRVGTTEGLLYLKTTLHVSLSASALFGEWASVVVHHDLGGRGERPPVPLTSRQFGV